MRTAVTLVPREYKFAKNFKEEWLEKPAFQKGRALRSEHLSTMLTLALALTEWWLDQDGVIYRPSGSSWQGYWRTLDLAWLPWRTSPG